MVRVIPHIYALQALAALRPAGSLALGAGTDRVVSVDASNTIGRFKNLQGTNTADTGASLGTDNIHSKDPVLAELWPEYGIEHVMISDALDNANYNWTKADDWMHFVTSHGAKATIQYGGNVLHSSPETAGKVGNGAHGSGFYDAIELFDVGAEADLQNTLDVQDDYDTLFPVFAAIAHGVANASDKAGVGAWGRESNLHENYTLYNPFVSRFYQDCKEQNVPLKAATFHFSNVQFSFDPYDVRRVTANFREQVLSPAGFPDLPIWMTEYGPNPSGVKPTSKEALDAYNDPAFTASFTIGTAMYSQDSPITQAFTWPGFGWGGSGAGNATFAPWFEKSANGSVIALNQASAWALQAQLLCETPKRVSVEEGSSSDGFAVLAGRSSARDTVHVLLNNYQPRYDMIREITDGMVPYINASTAAYPLLQGNGLFNGEQSCFNTNNTRFIVAVCNTFPNATMRENTTKAYRLVITNLPWSNFDAYEVSFQRVGGEKHRSSTQRLAEVPLSVRASPVFHIVEVEVEVEID
ncbi:hypothetical protein BJX62DRAFT_232121 [Aspergillus germanicus]